MHELLGHPSDELTSATAKSLEKKLEKREDPCLACLVSKARKKAIPKMLLSRSTVPGERLYIDISGIKGKSRGGNKFWLLISDDATPKKWSFFMKAKRDQYEVIMTFLKKLKKRTYL